MRPQDRSRTTNSFLFTCMYAALLVGVAACGSSQTRSDEGEVADCCAPSDESAQTQTAPVVAVENEVSEPVAEAPESQAVAERAAEGAQRAQGESGTVAATTVGATVADIDTGAVATAVGAVVPYPVELWNSIVSVYATEDGGFRYDALRQAEAHLAVLDEFIEAVGEATPDAWSREQQLAFYINAYNALTIRSVLELWPVTSVLSERGFFDRRTHTIAGEEMTLNDLENDIIRARFNDPRIHFVVNCASVGCPWLQNYAFTARNIENALDRHTREYVARTLVQQADRSRMEVSSIFDWFESDFEVAGGVRAFIANHLEGDAGEYVSDESNRIRFFSYDWDLNDR